MNKFLAQISHILKTDKWGGSVTMNVARKTILIRDVAILPPEFFSFVHHHHARLQVESSKNSLSGFDVLVTMTTSLIQKMIVFVVVIAVLFALLASYLPKYIYNT
jgi:hypothetical protein